MDQYHAHTQHKLYLENKLEMSMRKHKVLNQNPELLSNVLVGSNQASPGCGNGAQSFNWIVECGDLDTTIIGMMPLWIDYSRRVIS